MASLGPGDCVVVVSTAGGSKASHIKLKLQREPRTGKTWFLAGSFLPNEAHANAAVRELFAETYLTPPVDDLALLSGIHVRVPLPSSQHQLVYIFLASVHVPYVIANLRTPAKVEQVVNVESNIQSHGT
jgi:ADP-ribose pyrophosphatase YjhB (NUDIX family)